MRCHAHPLGKDFHMDGSHDNSIYRQWKLAAPGAVCSWLARDAEARSGNAQSTGAARPSPESRVPSRSQALRCREHRAAALGRPSAPWPRRPGSYRCCCFPRSLRRPAGGAGPCRGAPMLPQGLQPEQELQFWNEVDDACSSFLSSGAPPQVSNEMEELCLMIMGTQPKTQEQDEKDNTKRFLFHYSKTQKLGNSNVMSSVVHPLLQLVPQLHERRMKRFNTHEELRSPLLSRSQGYFLFRPRNGRRSSGFV
ncbi:neuromedin-U [Tupaia chinensis]|uniref:neuromedin-U n=1 Tax=Tupaia chinensis TaxID=246437 RepID=UPI000FFBD2EC|nr:neuromedin-U [Tupaia chinensis]